IPLMASGDNAGAIAMASKVGPEYMAAPFRNAITGLLEDSGNMQAREVLRTAISGENISVYDINAYLADLVLVHAGDVDFVIDRAISQARKFSFGNVEQIWSPIYAPFRQHPRFEEYLEVLNLPGYWDQTGWPDICQRDQDRRIQCQ
ncbi:MAG: hypothetical protein OEU84_17215, partial [Xanthomonadales bacterium]|nr:hypothetical protein [Xanthomonadales bacterium]